MELDGQHTRDYLVAFQKPFEMRLLPPLGVPLVYGSYEPIVHSVIARFK